MGGGGGGPTQTTVSNSNLPEYAQPYYDRLMANAEGVSQMPYVTYPGQQTANYSGSSLGAADGIYSLPSQSAPLYDAANTGFGDAQTGAHDVATSSFDNAAASKYMSPYIQNVIDQQKRSAVRDDAIAKQSRDALAVQHGAFGGSRQALQDSEAQRALLDRTNSIEANGLNTGYNNAESQFNADRQGQLGGISQENQAATGIAALGSTVNSNGLQDYQALNNMGQQEQNYQQKGLDTAYNDFVNQRDANKNNLGWLSGILHGSVVGSNSDTVSSAQGPSLASQIGGLGIGALATSKAM